MSNVEETEERFLWNQESTCELIDLYKKYPVLYAPKDGNYKNKPKRLEALKAIKSEMNRRGKKMTVEDIKRKIHVLRTQYANQLSKIRKSQMIGTRPENIYKPTLWCFAQLDFLRNSDSALSGDGEGQADQDDESVHESKDLGQLNIVERGEETQEIESFYEEIGLVKREESTPTRVSPETSGIPSGGKIEDDLSTFGRLVELELRKISGRHSLRKAKKEILNILMDAQEACDD